MDKPTFDSHVENARRILQHQRQMWGESPAHSFALLYVYHQEEKGTEVLRCLINASIFNKAAWDALRILARVHIWERKPLPPQLLDWLDEVLAQRLPRPKTKGKDPLADFYRNRAIVVAVWYFSHQGMTATRNGSGPGQCCYEGGSACDVVGKALQDKNTYNENLVYKSIERIWTLLRPKVAWPE